jgi:hypothetical protein
MALRVSESGVFLPSLTTTATPAAITAPNNNSVVVTDAMFIGAKAVVVTFQIGGNVPGANLMIVGAFVSNTATGAITIRFAAVGANYVSQAETILIQTLA